MHNPSLLLNVQGVVNHNKHNMRGEKSAAATHAEDQNVVTPAYTVFLATSDGK